MATLEARSVVGLEETGIGEEEGDGDGPVHRSEDPRIFRITAIHCRFDEGYDDSQSGGYRDLSLSVEVSLPDESAPGSATDPGTA